MAEVEAEAVEMGERERLFAHSLGTWERKLPRGYTVRGIGLQELHHGDAAREPLGERT